ncbi:short-chain dehydrogenase/reductase SDR [Gluconacetobacter diazotrophicus PA1 5]|uniref:SDR family oxidoreductase n=1 Tax=Gluconacetobacter diazotrophicus TaxID=33996 RepID=UPI000173BC0D|nr:SDR family oxidoreductase [Gluconacetobacter diazotrophicus]ACI50667.1 short-chain dehydrogenase/reductase SDR [Gluconacetobacter diazotrophicus PA1 5]TWB09499.1 L-fucose dehydrogenase [Gluconacetobacter diazotrophicus]
MDLRLTGHVVIVTGGASGIGAAISEVLAEEGAVPAIVGKFAPDPHFMARLRARQPRASFHQADLTEDGACASAVRHIVETHGRIDGLVNNAGTNDSIGIEAGPDAFRRSLNANLVHCYTMLHHALPGLRDGGGSVVNIASKTALTGQGGTSGYAAAKGGMLSLTREWAVTLAADLIRVNAVIPSEVWTPQYDSWLDGFADREEKLRAVKARIPLGRRMTTPREIADSVVFLLSPVSSHTTGQWVVVDGGYIHLDRAF